MLNVLLLIDIITNNDNDMDDTFEYNADEDELEDVYDDNLIGMTDNIAANVADRYDMVVLDIESDLEENSHYANDSEIDEDGSIEETAETNDINEISTDSLLKLKQSTTNEKPSLQSNMIAAIELLSLLRASGASLNLYEKIVFWVEKRIQNAVMDALPTRDKVIKVMENRHHLKCIAPIKKRVTLPSINLPIEIPVNPLLGCIYSLLSDPILMNSENLIFPDPTNPSSVPEFGNKYSEINTGLSYQSFQKQIKHFGNAVQVPLIIFIDGTAIDRSGRHSQTPVMFTLGIFKQSVRNRSSAWRNLGFVKNNVKEQYSAQEIKRVLRDQLKYPKNHDCYVPDNHNDFHKQISCIINDLL